MVLLHWKGKYMIVEHNGKKLAKFPVCELFDLSRRTILESKSRDFFMKTRKRQILKKEI